MSIPVMSLLDARESQAAWLKLQKVEKKCVRGDGMSQAD